MRKRRDHRHLVQIRPLGGLQNANYVRGVNAETTAILSKSALRDGFRQDGGGLAVAKSQ